MQSRRLGRTEHWSSVAILGGAAFSRSNPEETEAGFTAALAAGVNHLDIAPQYGDAQRLVGPLVPAVRDRLFVACKTLRKNGDGVRAQLEESLQLLGCDSFDLYQLHAVTDMAVLDKRRDAVAAILAARDEGLVRFVGITGHDLGAPAAHAEAIRRYDLDTVMFPVNPRLWADDAYRRDAETLLALAGERDCGVMAIKAAAARPWGDREHSANTWYEPYTGDDELERGVNFALSVEGVHAFCTPGDTTLLPRVLHAAEHFTTMDPAQRVEASAQVAAEPGIFPLAANA
jgi:aryl-alcohol dehydrogenase-like predicted oxidoreductase